MLVKRDETRGPLKLSPLFSPPLPHCAMLLPTKVLYHKRLRNATLHKTCRFMRPATTLNMPTGTQQHSELILSPNLSALGRGNQQVSGAFQETSVEKSPDVIESLSSSLQAFVLSPLLKPLRYRGNFFSPPLGPFG